jgi:hypothetical protein
VDTATAPFGRRTSGSPRLVEAEDKDAVGTSKFTPKTVYVTYLATTLAATENQGLTTILSQRCDSTRVTEESLWEHRRAAAENAKLSLRIATVGCDATIALQRRICSVLDTSAN